MDETLHAPEAIDLLVPDLDLSYATKWAGLGLEIGGRRLPIASHSYAGSLKSYVLAGAFGVFGISVMTMRLVTILLSTVTIALTYLFARRLFGVPAATWGALLLATDASFIIFSRLDYGPLVLPTLFRAAALCIVAGLLTERDRPPRAMHLWALGLVLGVGIYDRVYFLWFAVPCVLALAALSLKGRLRLTRAHLVSLLLGVALGVLPLVAYNFARDFPTVRLILAGGPAGKATTLPLSSVTLAWLGDHIPPKALTLWKLLRGDLHAEYLFMRRLPSQLGPPGSLFPFAVCGSLLLGLAWLRKRRGDEKQRWGLAFVLLTLLLTLAFVFATPVANRGHHFAAVLPLPHVLVGIAIANLVTWQQTRRPRAVPRSLGLLVGSALLLSNLLVVRQYAVLIDGPTTRPIFSDAIYELTSTLRARHHDCLVQVMAWGIGNPLMLCSQGTLAVRQPFWGLTQPDTEPGRALLSRALHTPGSVFVMYTADEKARSPIRETLMEHLAAAGLDHDEELVPDTRGRPVYSIVTVRASGFAPCGRGGGAAGSTAVPDGPRSITLLLPPAAEMGSRFNVQPDGASAIAVRGEGFTRGDLVWWGGVPLATTFGDPTYITALVPDELLGRGGDVVVSVRDPRTPTSVEVRATFRLAPTR